MNSSLEVSVSQSICESWDWKEKKKDEKSPKMPKFELYLPEHIELKDLGNDVKDLYYLLKRSWHRRISQLPFSDRGKSKELQLVSPTSQAESLLLGGTAEVLRIPKKEVDRTLWC